MADSYSKKEREKKKRKRRKEKAERRQQRKEDGGINPPEFMYVDFNGNLTTTPPEDQKRPEIKLEDIDVSTPKTEKSDEPEGPRTGKVKFFHAEKGYGFIEDEGTRESFFVHVSNLIDEINDNDAVTFEIEPGPKGMVAVAVKLV